MTFSFCRLPRAQRGFSLVEIAIVLAVAGGIMGGLWSLSGAVNNQSKQQRFASLLLILSNNVRGFYVGSSGINGADVPTLMPKLAAANVFPGDATRASGGVTVVDSPFGSFTNPTSAASAYNSIYVCGWTATGQTKCSFSSSGVLGQFYAVEALIPINGPCINAITANGSSASLPGLAGVFVNGTLLDSPVKVPAIKTACATAASGGGKVALVDFVFRMTP